MNSQQPLYIIRTVAQRTGLSPHTIRAWERRYGAVEPQRSAGNQRLYSEEDVQRLDLLRRATEAGHSIGRIAQLGFSELSSLVNPELAEYNPGTHKKLFKPREKINKYSASWLQEALEHVESMDGDGLADALRRAQLALPLPALIEELLRPLMVEIGLRWKNGALRVGQEHMASAAVRSFLWGILERSGANSGAPAILLTTPPGFHHEIGALMAAAAAVAEGWRAVYLGPNLPIEETASSALQVGARAVGLSLNYPPDDARVPEQMAELRRLLPNEVVILAGGDSAPAYAEVLQDYGVFVCSDTFEMRQVLNRLRRPDLADDNEETGESA